MGENIPTQIYHSFRNDFGVIIICLNEYLTIKHFIRFLLGAIMKNFLNAIIIFVCVINNNSFPQDKSNNGSSNITQYYSGKFGFYSPDKKLNNGLLFGVDGITEFNKYNFLLSGAIDLYYKKTFDPFNEPKPDKNDQSLILLPLHINAGYKLFDVRDADTKGYLGLGAGYYLYFYNLTYSSSSGGIIGGITNKNAAKQGGNFVFTLFGRILIGKIFVEPRFYFAASEKENIEDHRMEIDPSGFTITLGFQY